MMKRTLLALPIMLSAAMPAFAMESSSVPPKFPIPWANAAGAQYIRNIPVNSQIGIQDCAASLTDGFPPLSFTPVGAGGCSPAGQDFNGIFKQITLWDQWQATGAPVGYDSSFSSSIGGYPQGAILGVAGSPGSYWFSTADNNTTDPDTGGANWEQFSPIGAQTRSLSVSGSFTTNATDGTIGLVATAASSTTLPSGAVNGKPITYQDLGNNFGTDNITISAPTGQTIAGLSSITLATNGESATFKYYSGLNMWGYSAATPGAPSGQVAYFNMSSCPNGWQAANGSGGTVNVVGQFIRSLNTGSTGFDPNRTLASAQSNSVQPLGIALGASNWRVGTFDTGLNPGSGSITAGGSHVLVDGDFTVTGTGTETRPQNVALLACQKN